MELQLISRTQSQSSGSGSQSQRGSTGSLKDVVISVAKDAMENSPVSDMWPAISKVGRTPTGNNKRSIQ